MYSRRDLVGAMVGLVLVGGVLLLPGAALADFKEHVGEAIEHADAAVKHGRLGHADMLIEHADAALRYAKEAQKLVASPPLDEGIRELEASVSEGRAGHPDLGVQHAERALGHLAAVKTD